MARDAGGGMMRRTQTIAPDKITEMWFVYDREDGGFQIFYSEEAAEKEYQKTIEKYREYSSNDEWGDEVESVSWGKIYQTTELIEIENLNNVEEDFDDRQFAEAFAIEHRACHDIVIREEMRRYLFRNVACEFRKTLADFHQMPDLPGWS
jgi:hypothetical protein